MNNLRDLFLYLDIFYFVNEEVLKKLSLDVATQGFRSFNLVYDNSILLMALNCYVY